MGGGAASGRASAEKSMETGEFHLLLREIELLLLDSYGTAPILSAVLSSAATAAHPNIRRLQCLLLRRRRRRARCADGGLCPIIQIDQRRVLDAPAHRHLAHHRCLGRAQARGECRDGRCGWSVRAHPTRGAPPITALVCAPITALNDAPITALIDVPITALTGAPVAPPIAALIAALVPPIARRG